MGMKLLAVLGGKITEITISGGTKIGDIIYRKMAKDGHLKKLFYIQ
jgi:hypothetical protein